MKSSLRFFVLGAAVVVLAQACGSSEGKKKVPGPEYTSGGEGAEGGAGFGASSNTGGSPTGKAGDGSLVDGGMPATDGGTSNAEAGTPGMSSAGASDAAGDNGGPNCPSGFGECDGNPDTVCEQPLNLVTSCGDCTTKCVSTNGQATCGDDGCVLACNDGYADCDGKPDNGCEVDLTSDASHCGACARDCATHGATCGTNVCSPIALQQDVALNTDNSGARSWAFTPVGILANGFNSYVLRRLPLDGGAPLTIWAPSNKTAPIEGMTVVDGDVYWSERGDTSKKYGSVVFKKAITAAAGVQPTAVFVPELAATFLRRQGNALYWASGGYQEEGGLAGAGGFIYTRALDALEADGGTKIVTVDQGNFGNIQGLAVTSDALYWVTNQATGTQYELRTAPLAGSPIGVVPAVFANATLAITNVYAATNVSLVTQGAYVYFNRDANDAQDGVYRFKSGLAKPERIALADNVTSLLVDTDYVYFTEGNVAGMWRAPINNGAGGAAEKIATGYYQRLLGVDDTFVYAANTLACCSGADFAKVIK